MNPSSVLFHELSRVQTAVRASHRHQINQSKFHRKIEKRDVQPNIIGETFIETILTMRLHGNSYSKIASKLNREGCRALRGGRWYGAALYSLMRDRCCEFLCEWPKQISEENG